jgi:hypothetical protein
MVCAEKNRLIAEYAAATRSLAAAARRLSGLDSEAFREALAKSEAARVQCDKARKALMRHKDEHAC